MTTNIRDLAIAFADKQAALRPMSPVEYMQLVDDTERLFSESHSDRAPVPESEPVRLIVDPKTAIKKTSVTCCICGQSFRLLTARHMATHGLTLSGYRALCGYAPDQSLTCTTLRKQRTERMKSMRLWERRQSKTATPEEPVVTEPPVPASGVVTPFTPAL